jgi:hypothetical protein
MGGGLFKASDKTPTCPWKTPTEYLRGDAVQCLQQPLERTNAALPADAELRLGLIRLRFFADASSVFGAAATAASVSLSSFRSARSRRPRSGSRPSAMRRSVRSPGSKSRC